MKLKMIYKVDWRNWNEEHMNCKTNQVSAMEMRAKTLTKKKNDLESRLEELV